MSDAFEQVYSAVVRALPVEAAQVATVGVLLLLALLAFVAAWLIQGLRLRWTFVLQLHERMSAVEIALQARAPREALALTTPRFSSSLAPPPTGVRPLTVLEEDGTSIARLVEEVGVLADEAAGEAKTRVFEPRTRVVNGRPSVRTAGRRGS